MGVGVVDAVRATVVDTGVQPKVSGRDTEVGEAME